MKKEAGLTARLTEQEFKKQLSAGDFPRLCLIYGDEDYLKKHCVTLLENKSVGSAMADFNLHRINGESCEIDDIYQAAESMPLMSEKSCVVVKDLALDKLSAPQLEQMTELLSDPADFCVLVFWQDSVAFDEKKNEKTKRIASLIDENGVLVRLDKMSGAPLYKLLENGAHKRGCEMSRDVSAYLAARVGDDLNSLLNELEKLCFYKNGGEISRRDVDAICTRSLDAGIFDLSKALTGGTAQQALNILGDLLAQKEKPVVILGTLISTYVDMYRAQVALSSGESASAPAKFFDYRRKEFRLTNAARNSANISLDKLRECLDILADADTKIKSTAFDERRILEELMLRLMLTTD